jgi:hypothetical protein
MRIVSRILQAHEGQQRKAGGPAASGSHIGELECLDEFLANHEPAKELEYGESVPMNHRPTLRLADILRVDRPEQSWDVASGAPGPVREKLGDGRPQHGRSAHQGSIRTPPGKGQRSHPAGPAHHSKEIKEDCCPALFQVPQGESTTGGDSR